MGRLFEIYDYLILFLISSNNYEDDCIIREAIAEVKQKINALIYKA